MVCKMRLICLSWDVGGYLWSLQSPSYWRIKLPIPFYYSAEIDFQAWKTMEPSTHPSKWNEKQQRYAKLLFYELSDSSGDSKSVLNRKLTIPALFTAQKSISKHEKTYKRVLICQNRIKNSLYTQNCYFGPFLVPWRAFLTFKWVWKCPKWVYHWFLSL